MFFVGITGQLITLILTVTLPLIMLFSGQQKTAFYPSQLNYEVKEIRNYLPCTDIQTACFSNEYIENDKCAVIFDEQLIPEPSGKNEKIKWKTFYLNASGNKAPPAHRFIFS